MNLLYQSKDFFEIVYGFCVDVVVASVCCSGVGRSANGTKMRNLSISPCPWSIRAMSFACSAFELSQG